MQQISTAGQWCLMLGWQMGRQEVVASWCMDLTT
jgi:hypothetical protein